MVRQSVALFIACSMEIEASDHFLGVSVRKAFIQNIIENPDLHTVMILHFSNFFNVLVCRRKSETAKNTLQEE